MKGATWRTPTQPPAAPLPPPLRAAPEIARPADEPLLLSLNTMDDAADAAADAAFFACADEVPQSEADLIRLLSNPVWRIASGRLYKIMLKEGVALDGADADGLRDSEGNKVMVMPFRPNRVQRLFMRRLWHRTVALKARQLGLTTLVCLLWLDHALFNANQRCGVIAQDKDAASAIFRDKVRFAYNNLPPAIRSAVPLVRDSAVELLFSNNSSVRVATSMRSGTTHRLLISEMGKIGAKYPEKAHEIMTGSLPSVPMSGISIVESTAEGQGGDFYDIVQGAKAMAEGGRTLTQLDYRLQFFPWWADPHYTLPADADVAITQADIDYFTQLERQIGGRRLSLGQRKWYVATRRALSAAGKPEKMYQEYPGTVDEAFMASTEGLILGSQMTLMRTERRITGVPYAAGVPVDTSWDIGSTDGTAVWLSQYVGLRHRLIGFVEDWGKPYDHFTSQLQATGYTWGRHYLPHDAEQARQQGLRVTTPLAELRALMPAGEWVVVPRIGDIWHGVLKLRSFMTQVWIDEEKCASGIKHLSAYRRTWNKAAHDWGTEPDKTGGHSEAADALRQLAQGWRESSKADQKQANIGRQSRDWRS